MTELEEKTNTETLDSNENLTESKDDATVQELMYIELTKDLEFRDSIWRFTKLAKGAVGFIITNDVDVLKLLDGFSKERMGRYFDIMEKIINTNQTMAMISGYICGLKRDEFIPVSKHELLIDPTIF